MNLLTVAVFLCTLIILAVCITLVFNKHYEDGLIGRIALSVIAIAAAGRASGIWDSDFMFAVTPQGALVWIGLTLFLVRHLYRFLRWRSSGDGDWRIAKPK